MLLGGYFSNTQLTGINLVSQRPGRKTTAFKKISYNSGLLRITHDDLLLTGVGIFDALSPRRVPVYWSGRFNWSRSGRWFVLNAVKYHFVGVLTVGPLYSNHPSFHL